MEVEFIDRQLRILSHVVQAILTLLDPSSGDILLRTGEERVIDLTIVVIFVEQTKIGSQADAIMLAAVAVDFLLSPCKGCLPANDKVIFIGVIVGAGFEDGEAIIGNLP